MWSCWDRFRPLHPPSHTFDPVVKQSKAGRLVGHAVVTRMHTVVLSRTLNRTLTLVPTLRFVIQKAEQDRGSLLGEEFIQYYKAKGEDPWAHLPPVEVRGVRLLCDYRPY